MLTLKEVQEVETGILEAFHQYCEENGLRYCMTYGTLIGAARHRGFIPWDNDIDLYMPRPDYDRLIEQLKEKPMGPHYKLLHYSLDHKFRYMAARIVDTRTAAVPSYLRETPDDLGVWIDLFAVDGCWEHPLRHPVYWTALSFNKMMQRAYTYYLPGKKGWKNAAKKVLMTIFRGQDNRYQARADKWARKCDYASHQKVTDITDWTRRDYSVYLTHEDFDEAVLMDFEGRKFYAPKDYDRFLRSVYGEYMTLPPESERTTHDLEVEWRKD